MASDNIFSGLKVVDLASFIAAPSAAQRGRIELEHFREDPHPRT